MAYSEVIYTVKDLERLRGELSHFIDNVKQDGRTMLQEAEGVGLYWNDDQYRQFLRYMESLNKALGDCAKQLSKSNDNLNEFIVALLADV